MKKPLALIILDGFGYNPQDYGNAIAAAKKPNIDRLLATCPHTLIGASGLDVGLPDGQMGNSEVGHTNIGAGRIVYQELTRITKSIEDGDFFQNPALLAAVENCKKNDSALHLMGLCSDGGVHSHNTHLYGLLRAGEGCGAREGVRPLLHGRPRRAPDLWRGFSRGAGSRDEPDRHRPHRHGDGPVLRDGPRQPLGARAAAPMTRS